MLGFITFYFKRKRPGTQKRARSAIAMAANCAALVSFSADEVQEAIGEVIGMESISITTSTQLLQSFAKIANRKRRNESLRREPNYDDLDDNDLSVDDLFFALEAKPAKIARSSPIKEIEEKEESVVGVLAGREAEEYVQKKLNSGEWKLARATSMRRGYSHRYCPMPDHYYTMDFVVAGTESTQFKHKETIKNAGYTHYSGCDKAGWHPFRPMKAFGKTVSMSYSRSFPEIKIG